MIKSTFWLLILFLSFKQLVFASNHSEIFPKEKIECAKSSLKILIDQKAFIKAGEVAKKCGDVALIDFIKIRYLLASDADKLDYYDVKRNFIALSKYPFSEELKKVLINSVVDPIELRDLYETFIVRWEKDEKIYNALAHVFLKNQLADFYLGSDQRMLIDTWLYSNLNHNKTLKFYQDYKEELSLQDIKDKISILMWRNDFAGVLALLKLTDKNYQKYYDTRMAFRKNNKNALARLADLPEEYYFDEGLFYDIAWWFQRRNKEDKVTKYLTSLPEKLINPEAWYKIRILNSRYLIEEGRYKDAYAVLTNHQVQPGTVEYAELEWMLGWVALEFLQEAQIALQHFKALEQNVRFPISVSRAKYWLGRSYKKANLLEEAKNWFEQASNYSTTFYGQMSLLELHDDFSITLPEFIALDANQIRDSLVSDTVARIGFYLDYSGYKTLARNFFKRAIKNSADQDNIYAIIALAEYNQDYILASQLARYATKFNIVTSANYPIIDNVKMKNKEKSLLHAIVKQESGFNTKAISKAGAIGYMQIMPNTAREIAKKLKISYSKRKLAQDPEYNIKLGSYYINYLMKKFDGSYVLSVASYNAGPSNVKKWMVRNGDPRHFSDINNVINWVELIPFPETRNYVQRIIENAVIYMHLLEKEKS